jgi:hypothetical protein
MSKISQRDEAPSIPDRLRLASSHPPPPSPERLVVYHRRRAQMWLFALASWVASRYDLKSLGPPFHPIRKVHCQSQVVRMVQLWSEAGYLRRIRPSKQ